MSPGVHISGSTHPLRPSDEEPPLKNVYRAATSKNVVAIKMDPPIKERNPGTHWSGTNITDLRCRYPFVVCTSLKFHRCTFDISNLFMIKIGNIQINQKMHRILVGMHASPCVRSTHCCPLVIGSWNDPPPLPSPASESEPLSEILGLPGQHVMPVDPRVTTVT